MIPREPPPQGPLGTDFEYSFFGVLGVLLSLGAPWPMGQIAEVMSDDQLLLSFLVMFLHIFYVGALVTEACFPARFVTTALKVPQPVFLAIKVVYSALAVWEFSGHGDNTLMLAGILVGAFLLTELGAFLKSNKLKKTKKDV